MADSWGVAVTKKSSRVRSGTANEAIRQSVPFRSLGQEAAINLMLTHEAVRWQIGDMLASRVEGLTLPQYNALRILRGAGHEGLPTLEIADRMVERTPGITRMLDRLEAKGLVERTRSSDDRRQVLCRLTKAGSSLVRSLDRPVDKNDEELFASLNQRELRELIRLLDKVRNGIAAAG